MAKGQTAYALSAYGPNGFLRTFKGTLKGRKRADLQVHAVYHADSCGITLEIRNGGTGNSRLRITDAYTKRVIHRSPDPGETVREHWTVSSTFGWYDLTVESDTDPAFERRLAGHVEAGADSMSDPAIGQT